MRYRELTINDHVGTVSAMTEHETPWYHEAAMPALLRHARTAYRSAVRDALDEAGCEDMPPNGSYVVGAIARTGSPLGDVIRELGMSKQAAGQLVDVLVARGYLERAPDPGDRRRLTVSLTERGQLAAETVATAVRSVDAQLDGCVGAERVGTARAVLAALIGLSHPGDDEEPGHPPGSSPT